MLQIDKEVDNLIFILTKSGFDGDINIIYENLAYYAPRLRNKYQLEKLVQGIFDFSIWNRKDIDPFCLFDMFQAIFQRKLEISEPIITISQFYRMWDQSIQSCKCWTIPKLLCLGGIISTRTNFEELQDKIFIDDDGIVHKLYHHWKFNFFLPIWTNMVNKNLKFPAIINQLSLVYSIISSPDDKCLPWNIIVQSLINLVLQYFHGSSDLFVERYINQIAKCLNFTIPYSSSVVADKSLNILSKQIFDFSLSDMNNYQKIKLYNDKYYSNVMFLTILIVHGFLEHPDIQMLWYYQCAMTLFYMNYIVSSFGTNGFRHYNAIYSIIIAGITSDTKSFINIINTMNGNTYCATEQNSACESRITFMLDFMEKSLPVLKISSETIESSISPIIIKFLGSKSRDIRELAHMAQLSIFSNTISGLELVGWKLTHLQSYFKLLKTHFLHDLLSGDHLLIIIDRLCAEFPYLTTYDSDLIRFCLQFIFLTILNCQNSEKKAVLCMCLLIEMKYIDGSNLNDWLDNYFELAIDLPNKEKLINELWEFVQKSRKMTAINWWYNHTCIKSRL